MAMSGGVDSSVAAKLLVDAGYEVVGATMHLFDRDERDACEEKTCCSLEDVEDARRVCRQLGIEHYTLNYTKEFGERVMRRFCREYEAGRTPNPCIDCNRYLKFEALQRKRRELGCDYVATGHYVRRVFDEATGAWGLWKAADANKDQSYVLYHVDQETLAHMLFPLGELVKPEVREIAAAAGFVQATKAESQDICFVKGHDYAAFIGGYDGFEPEPGPIVDADGRVLGEHAGLLHYTVGQRKGLGVAAAEPLYVVEKDVDTNTLVVGPREALATRTVVADDVNLIDCAPFSERRVQAKTNYRAAALPATARMRERDGARGGWELEVAFDEPAGAVSAGQALVLYDGEHMLGGGTIVRASGRD
jgi:tRNA-specific 2-thiouridylase